MSGVPSKKGGHLGETWVPKKFGSEFGTSTFLLGVGSGVGDDSKISQPRYKNGYNSGPRPSHPINFISACTAYRLDSFGMVFRAWCLLGHGLYSKKVYAKRKKDGTFGPSPPKSINLLPACTGHPVLSFAPIFRGRLSGLGHVIASSMSQI